MDDEETTWRLVKDIKQECLRSGHSVSEELVCFTMRHIFQNPKNGFKKDFPLERHDVKKLMAFCVESLMHDQGPVMETMRMQTVYTTTFSGSQEWISEYRRDVEAKTGPLSREIVESQVTSKSGLDALYSKLVSLLVLRSGIGNPTSTRVLREAAAALQSIFPPMALVKFMRQSRLDKRREIRELALVVAGVRIFNWDAKRGGAGVENLPSILSNAIETTIRNVTNLSIVTGNKILQLTSLTEKLLYTDAGNEASSEVDRETIKFGLVNVRQFQSYLSALAVEVEDCNNRLSTLDQDLLKNLGDLQTTIGSQLAVPSTNVYPEFTRLAQTWMGFQEEMVVLSHLNSLIRDLYAHTKCQARLPVRALEDEVNELSLGSEDERNEASSQGTINTDGFLCDHVCPGDVENYDAVPLELAGHCPVALVSGQGFVVPGNRRIGYLRYRGKYYSCSHCDRAEQFGRNPDMFLSAINSIANDNPCLLKLLAIEVSSQAGMTKENTCEQSSQTTTHALESFVDPDYKWNEWDLRKDALLLSKQAGATTKSVQTDTRHGGGKTLVEKASQVQPKRHQNQSIQVDKAGREVSTDTGETRSCIIGLAGEGSFQFEHIVLDELSCNV